MYAVYLFNICIYLTYVRYYLQLWDVLSIAGGYVVSWCVWCYETLQALNIHKKRLYYL